MRLVCKRGYMEPPSIASLLGQTSFKFELPERVAAIAELRERRRDMDRVQRSCFEMALAEVVEAVREADIVKSRGLAYTVDQAGQLVCALPLT